MICIYDHEATWSDLTLNKLSADTHSCMVIKSTPIRFSYLLYSGTPTFSFYIQNANAFLTYLWYKERARVNHIQEMS